VGCPDARELALEWSKRGAGWTSEKEFEPAWYAHKPGATTIATLIHLAKQEGTDLSRWQNTIDGGNAANGNPLGPAVAVAATSGQSEAPSYADPYAEFVGPKFPISILPSVLADFVEAEHKAMGADLSALAMTSLAAVGAALTSEMEVQVGDGWYERTIFWIAIIGDRSTMKTPVITKMNKQLVELDNEQDDNQPIITRQT